LTSSGDFVKGNIERVLGDGTKYQRRPLFCFGEVFSEFGTMNGIGNVVWETGGDFSLLNNNQDLLFWEVEEVWARFHISREGGLSIACQHVN
jgi:hypothetical protein